MKKLFLSIFLFHTSPAINAQGILDTYDSEPIIWRMTCWTGETYKTYAIQGKNIVVDAISKTPISEQKGNIYAGTSEFVTGNESFGTRRTTLIVDYDNRKVTKRMKRVGTEFGYEEVFECN